MDYQETGTPKPGAAVLAEMNAGARTRPLLITQNYGRGRTAVMATSGTWRWQMSQPLGDNSHVMFWQQLLRWLVSDTPGRVVASVPSQILVDDGRVRFSADVRDKNYMPRAMQGRGPSSGSPNPPRGGDDSRSESPGVFKADWTAEKPGTYTVEITAKRGRRRLGRDVLTFQRIDGVAENFHTEQNRELLEKLASQTGGRYYQPQQLSKLGSEIPYSAAGITIRETMDLWNMPIIFILILLFPFSEWFLRRKWGVV